MRHTAENVARQWQHHPAAQQGRVAVGSQNNAEAAQKAGRFKDELARSGEDPQGDIVVDLRRIPPRRATPSMRREAPSASKDGHRDRRQCLPAFKRRRRRGGAVKASEADKAKPARVLGL